MRNRKTTSTHKGCQIKHHKPLRKNAACLECRTRKVRCDGAFPACATCIRSANYFKKDTTNLVCDYTSFTPKRQLHRAAAEREQPASRPVQASEETESASDTLVEELQTEEVEVKDEQRAHGPGELLLPPHIDLIPITSEPRLSKGSSFDALLSLSTSSVAPPPSLTHRDSTSSVSSYDTIFSRSRSHTFSSGDSSNPVSPYSTSPVLEAESIEAYLLALSDLSLPTVSESPAFGLSHRQHQQLNDDYFSCQPVERSFFGRDFQLFEGSLDVPKRDPALVGLQLGVGAALNEGESSLSGESEGGALPLEWDWEEWPIEWEGPAL